VRIAGCSIVLFAILLGAIGPVRAEDAPIVVLLSWDGMRHDYPDRAEFPALTRVEREGVRADRLIPVFPSSTFPGHVSMATGTYPDRHGIVDNVFLDREKGRYSYSSDANWIEAEPLWIAAERQGVPTATYFWVGSESDWRDQGTTYRVAPFDGQRAEALKVGQILEWLSLPDEQKPRLIMSYWAGADGVGHDQGPNGEDVVAQIKSQDAQLGRLLTGIDELGLWSRTTLVIVSDHGMAACTRPLKPGDALEAAGIEADVIGSAVAQIHLKDPTQEAAAGQVLEQFIAEIPGALIHRRETLPEEYRLNRADRLGEWIVIVPPPYFFSRSSAVESALANAALLMGREFGMHGYDPNLADMAGIFLAMGRGVPTDRPLEEVHQIDVAATVAGLLNIEPPKDSEGAPIW
jgi:predicted AlkP superfamily pyrophosphatase or phosphodiesterase